MATNKKRLTVTVDAALLAAVNAAVELGRAASVSAWVNEAIANQIAHERRLAALAEAVALYENEAGVITDAQMESRRRKDRAAAIRIAPKAPPAVATKGRSRRAG